MPVVTTPPASSSVLDAAHPFTRALLGFALVALVGYVALVALALRYVRMYAWTYGLIGRVERSPHRPDTSER